MNIEQEIRDIKKMIVQLDRTISLMMRAQQDAFNRLFQRQLDELKAVRAAFRMNVERDEDLMEALHESADPWIGC